MKDTNIKGAYFAPGSTAEHERGVLYQGDYQHESDGTGIAIRLHARALADAGLPVLLKPYTGQVLTSKGTYEPLHLAGIPPTIQDEVGHLTNASIAKLYPTIRHFVCHNSNEISRRVMRGVLGPLDDPELTIKARKAVYDGSVFYSVWERTSLDQSFVREMNRFADNWVPCEQNAEMLRKSGVKKVAVIPHPFSQTDPILKLTRRTVTQKTKKFYWIGRWEPRKNPVKLLKAFFTAFSPKDDVTLTIKSHGQWDGYPTLSETIEEVIQEGKWNRSQLQSKLTVLDGNLRRDQILKLHFDNNIYVAPSCGEAWCLPAFEAKLAGNRLIHVPFGGTQDFSESSSDIALDHFFEDVPSSYGWQEGAQWAQIHTETLCTALRDVSVPVVYRRPDNFDERFSMGAVGHLMRYRLREIFGSQKAGEYL